MSPLTRDAGLGNYLESLQIPLSSHVTTTGGWQWMETFIAIFTTHHLFACTGFWKLYICWLLSDVECIYLVPNQVSNCLFWHFQPKFVILCNMLFCWTILWQYHDTWQNAKLKLRDSKCSIPHYQLPHYCCLVLSCAGHFSCIWLIKDLRISSEPQQICPPSLHLKLSHRGRHAESEHDYLDELITITEARATVASSFS